MSDLIKKLAKKAYDEVLATTPSFLVTREIYEAHFGQLVAKECAKICEDLSFSPEGPSLEARYQRNLCAGEIRKQFGVPAEFRKGA